jgi:hypothetical protein
MGPSPTYTTAHCSPSRFKSSTFPMSNLPDFTIDVHVFHSSKKNKFPTIIERNVEFILQENEIYFYNRLYTFYNHFYCSDRFIEYSFFPAKDVFQNQIILFIKNPEN